MVYLEADRFLNELGKLFEKAKDKGSVNVVLKRSKLLPEDCLTHLEHCYVAEGIGGA